MRKVSRLKTHPLIVRLQMNRNIVNLAKDLAGTQVLVEFLAVRHLNDIKMKGVPSPIVNAEWPDGCSRESPVVAFR